MILEMIDNKNNKEQNVQNQTSKNQYNAKRTSQTQNNLVQNRQKQNTSKQSTSKQSTSNQNTSKQNTQKQNYQKQLESIIDKIQKWDRRPTLFLHSCCAPCSSHCMEYLREYFDITVFYYNPNISEDVEYRKRVAEEKRLIDAYNKQVEEQNFQGMNSTSKATKIQMIDGDYEPELFYEIAKGLEQCPEGGERCFKCYELRLRKTFEVAKLHNDNLKNGGTDAKKIDSKYDFITTTLTISPLKNAEKLNEIGRSLSEEYQIEWLPSDFKKKNGYKRSIELSAIYDLYRQDFCGCAYSKADRERQKQNLKG